MNLPVEVIDAVREGRCVLFLGGRFSAEAAALAGRPYPDDRELAGKLGWTQRRQLVGTRPKPGQGTEIPSVLVGARRYEATHGRAALEARLRMALDLPDVAPAAAHRLALRHFPLIFTTVLDDLTERAALAEGIDLEVRRRGQPIPAEPPVGGQRLLYKLRGDFAQSASLTLTELSPLPADAATAVQRLLRKQVLFFVGYKPDEEAFEQLWAELSEAYGGELPRCHMAVAQGRIDDYLWQKWVWRGLLMFTADPHECLEALHQRLAAP